MEPNFNGTLNMRLKWNKIKQYDEKKLKIVIYLATQWINGVGGTMVLGWSAGAIGQNSRRHHYRARLAQWRAGDLYILFFIGSG
jgi:hypothetical protein